ncbi:TIGR03899 family protein [Photobacterium sp.]|uniref:TIGR03899 family protein n=1 Tax=Photobacterium sp. TaxID=660 RepID=UPI00299F05FE|nr:TIGR03899 family protein [Photobacterium sp.]MDX1303503.1 TIGR03899 family protein [Photobacterium sp.]
MNKEHDENATESESPKAFLIMKEKNEKSSYIKNSRERTKEIAFIYAINAMISSSNEQDLQQRAEHREKREQQRRQHNLEVIIKHAHDACCDETADEPEPDWLTRFFSMAQNIHGASMQKLWGRILKQEILSAGSVSLKALETLQNMTHREAQTFQRASVLACHFGNDSSKRLLTGINIKKGRFPLLRHNSSQKLQLGNYQLPYSNLLILMELGLLLRTELESGEISLEHTLPFSYQNTSYTLKAVKKGITFTYYRFSPTGQELARLLRNKDHEIYKENLLDLLSKHFIVEVH